MTEQNETPDIAADDTEGHHLTPPVDETEGHLVDDDDTEGHVKKPF
jgi:hypothetical protein